MTEWWHDLTHLCCNFQPLSPKELKMRKHSDASLFPTEESERKKRSIWKSLIKRRSVPKANERDQELPPVSQKKESEENWDEKRKVRSNMEKGKTEIGKNKTFHSDASTE